MAGLPRRFAGMVVDLLAITLLWLFFAATGLLNLSSFIPPSNLFFFDHLLELFANRPSVFFPPFFALLLIGCTYTFFFHVFWRKTPGKWVVRTQLLSRNSLAPSPFECMLRCLGTLLCVFSLGLGWLWIFVNPERRGFHDLLSGTYVVVLSSPDHDLHEPSAGRGTQAPNIMIILANHLPSPSMKV